MRLAKYLASCGLGSRRSCEKLIEAGHISVNKKKVTDVSTDIVAGKDLISKDDTPIMPNPLVYYLLNKPLDYTTTRLDRHAKNIITDLLPPDPPVWPVGRLDKDTSGLILLTNDGDLTLRLTHPRYRKEKEYIVKTNIPLSDKDVAKVKRGIILEDGSVSIDSFEQMDDGSYIIVLHEGRKRIVRRIFAHLNKKVTSLERRRIDGLVLGNLRPGEYRKLERNEIEALIKNV